MLCSVYGCSNHSKEGVKTGPEKIHYFTFPKRENLLNDLKNGVISVKEKISFQENQL